MEYVSGEIFTVNGFKRGYLGVENHRIMDRGKDSNLKLPRNVEDLVAPPDGLKHRLLKETSDQEIVDGMRESIDEMTKTGISHFCDFRENGLQGINHLKKALVNSNISPIILSRPNQLTYNRDEVDLLLKNSQGIGLSSITDWKYSEIEKIAKHIKKRKKTFAIHASERIRENIDQILDLKPDFLIHMNCATESDLICVKDSNVPVVVCPRSNAFFGLKPNIELMNEIGIDIMLGTDNAMLNAPNILDELNYVKNMTEVFSIEHLLNMITYNPRKALNLDYSILDFNSLDEFIVLDKKNLGVLYISGNQREI